MINTSLRQSRALPGASQESLLARVQAWVEQYGLIALSILALFTLLTYTFVHTGALLSEYVRPGWVGYVAAFGVEAGIIAMSIRIGKVLRRLTARDRASWMSLLWQGAILLLVLAISAAANIVEGHKVKYGVELTLGSIESLDMLQVIIGLLATGLIPVVVLSMTEIVSGEIKETMSSRPTTELLAELEAATGRAALLERELAATRQQQAEAAGSWNEVAARTRQELEASKKEAEELRVQQAASRAELEEARAIWHHERVELRQQLAASSQLAEQLRQQQAASTAAAPASSYTSSNCGMGFPSPQHLGGHKRSCTTSLATNGNGKH
jgi:hypothetical protein